MTGQIMGARAGRRVLVPLAATLLLASCSRDTLLEVENPDQITPEVVSSPAGANAQRIAAIGNFATFYAGDVSGSGVGVNLASGLLSDEMVSARGGTEHLDQRDIQPGVFPVTSPWSFAGQAATQLIRANVAVRQYAPEGTATEQATKNAQLAQLHALLGYTYLLLGENYCNGIPIANPLSNPVTHEIVSNAELFDLAIAQFDTAKTLAGTATTAEQFRHLATVGHARALVNLDRHAEAATIAASVPTSFSYGVAYSPTGIKNSVYDWMFATLNFAPADREGGNGLPFVSANDPRVTVRRTPAGAVQTQAGQDGRQHPVQTVYTAAEAPVVLGSGIEARLIEAEAALQAGNANAFITNINAARATRTGLAALTAPGAAEAREDLLFAERGFWFWGTAHRLGDLRRLVRQYGRDAEDVFPTGSYFKGGAYGTDVVLVPSQAEQNLTIDGVPYAGCADESA